MKLNSLQLGILLFTAVWATGAFGQSCSTTNPCVPIKITDQNTTITGDMATLLKCGGTCTAASLDAYLSAPTQPSAWSIVATFSQKAASVTYNQPQAYSTLVSYAAYITPQGGPNGPVSAIVTFQNGQAPTGQAPLVSTATAIVTTGTIGVQ